MRDELLRRQSLADRLEDYVLAHPRVWLHAKDLRPVAGDAWRSRLVEVRIRLLKLDLELAWNRKNGGESAYMLRERPLGPAAHEYREASLF